MAETREQARKAFDLFVVTFKAKYAKAVECLAKDRDALLRFYDFPAEHWVHLRTTNPIESTFATVRLCTRRSKKPGPEDPALILPSIGGPWHALIEGMLSRVPATIILS